MNAVEVYITHIYSEMLDEDGWVSVDMDTLSWGSKNRVTRRFSPEEWASVKSQGYYMG